MNRIVKHKRAVRLAQGCSSCAGRLDRSGYCPACDEWDVCQRCHYAAEDASPLCEDHTNAAIYHLSSLHAE
jgi:hypothetical protein